MGVRPVARKQPSETPPPPGGPPGKNLFSVGEVVKLAGISRQVLHNYTVLGLLRPAERTPTNRRYYDESTFRRIELIRRQLKSGYTLQSLRELFPWEE
jgi:DNA-binding transcriptional MerR regulator